MIKYVTLYVCDHCKVEMVSDKDWFMVLRDTEEWNFCSPDCVCKEFQPTADALDKDYYAF